MRVLIPLVIFGLIIATNLLGAQEAEFEQVRILNQKKTKIENVNLKDVIKRVFSENDILVIAESQHHVKESRDFILEIIKQSSEFNCHRIILEGSPTWTFVLNDYILPQKHEYAKKYMEFRNESEKAFFDNLYTINLSRSKENYIKTHGIEGYVNMPEYVINAWKYFLNYYLTNLIETDFGKVVCDAKKDYQSVIRIRDYILLNEHKLKGELREQSVSKSYELLKKGLDDVFQRLDINKLFRSNWLEGAKRREQSSINYITEILSENRQEKFLSLYGGWHVEKRNSEEGITNIFSYLNYRYPKTKGKVHSWCIGFSSIDLTTLESSRDYDKMYGVYAVALKELHDFKDKNPDISKMPYFKFTNTSDWKDLIKLLSDDEKIRLISTEQQNNDFVLLQKYDEVILVPQGHYWELIPK